MTSITLEHFSFGRVRIPIAFGGDDLLHQSWNDSRIPISCDSLKLPKNMHTRRLIFDINVVYGIW